MACILLRIWHASSSSYGMHPPPHMACIHLLIWHASSSSYDMHRQDATEYPGRHVELPAFPVFLAIFGFMV